MKKRSSVVWRFFERIHENNRCVSVVCKLCESQYKYFGNTTNLRVHLINKHPIQWDLSQNGPLDDTLFSSVEDDESTNTKRNLKRKKYGSRNMSDKNVRFSISVDNNEDASGEIPQINIQRVDVMENSETDAEQNEDNEATLNMVRQMHTNENNSEEEWLDDPYQITHIETYEPNTKPHKYIKRKIKREVSSPSDLPRFYVAPKEKPYPYENRKDEYSVFGEYVANKLRKIKVPRTRGNLQQLITTILWQAEYGMYDKADAVKRVLMYSVQGDSEVNTSMEMDNHSHSIIQEEVVIENDGNQSTANDSLGIIN